MKALVAGASALILFMALLCMGAVAFLFGGDDATCTGAARTAPGAAPSLNAPTSVRTRALTWNTEQVHNAATIIGVGISMGVPVRGWIVAVAAAMQESNLINLPDLGDTNDADSLGLFQERPSQGWGTPDQIMNPAYSSTKFFQHLLTVPGWQTMTVAQAAQAVERSALPDAYATWEPDAAQLAGAVASRGNRAMMPDLEQCLSTCPPIMSTGSGELPTRAVSAKRPDPGFDGCTAGSLVLARAAVWLTAWAGGPVPYMSSPDAATWFGGYRRDCSGYASMALGLPGPGLDTADLAARSTPISKTELRAGDLLVNPAGDGAGHVVIFDRWVDTTMASYVGYEQSTDGGTHHRVIPYPYFAGYPMSPYRPVWSIK